MFKLDAKITAAIILAALFLGLLTGLIAPGLLERSCENEIIQSYQSLNNEFAAVLFQRDCGAITGFSTQVSIIKGGAKLPKSKGNIFIADDGDAEVALGSWGGPLVEIGWEGNNNLFIFYPKGSRVFLNEERYENIQIEYIAR